MTSVKDLKAMLAANSGIGGIPLPQLPGGGPTLGQGSSMNLTRRDSSSNSSSGSNRNNNSGSFSGNSAIIAAVASSTDDVPTTTNYQLPASPREDLEDDVVQSDGPMPPNLVLRRASIVGIQRRKPNVDHRMSLQIPDDHKITLADIQAETSTNKLPANTGDRLDDLEQMFKDRILKLEEEVGLLRAALVKANIPIPEPAPKSPISSLGAQPQAKKRVTSGLGIPPPIPDKSPRASSGRFGTSPLAGPPPPLPPRKPAEEDEDITSKALNAPSPRKGNDEIIKKPIQGELDQISSNPGKSLTLEIEQAPPEAKKGIEEDDQEHHDAAEQEKEASDKKDDDHRGDNDSGDDLL